MPDPLVTIDDIEDARRRVAPVLRATPVDRSDSLTELCGRPVLLKCEHLQRTGSFKIRGAYNCISRLPKEGTLVVAASAGNHAQGVALAASLSGLPSIVFMPESASLPKVEATRHYGAEVRFAGEVVDETLAAARRFAEEEGAVYVPPFDDPLIVAGQGTVGLELIEQAPDAEVVLVPVGGGGLISGIAAAVKAARPDVRVVGVEAAGAAAMVASLAAGHPVTLDRVSTIADGIALKSPSDLTLAHVRAFVDDVVTVDDEQISRALVLLLERAKAVVEPAGAVGLAALLAGEVDGAGAAAIVLSGGNVDPLLLTRLIEHGLSAAGRYLRLRVVLPDHPGALADLTRAIGDLALNILDVDHHRAGVVVGVEEVEVQLTLETRDPEHGAEVVQALRGAGYDISLSR